MRCSRSAISQEVDGLATLTEWPECEVETVSNSTLAPLKLEDFFQSLAAASKSALLLDFDGTLAPFRIDPSKVRPWAGVANLLEKIQTAGRTRLAIITGRPARDVESQLGLRNGLEIWGLHGVEHIYPDGRLEREELLPDEQPIIDAARNAISTARLGLRVEEKPNAVVVHWRGKPSQSIHSLRQHLLDLMQPFVGVAGVRLLEFDGGLELRAGRDKGDAVRLILDEMPTDAPVAYLGDDTTDEDAFRALNGRGLSVLVRRDWRPGSAQVWLRPPDQLRGFLTTWVRSVQH
jgi:trehalose 6-phosphate phosphatase